VTASLLARSLALLLAQSAAPARPFNYKAAAASVIPGVVFHGAGHFVAGQPQAARRLLLFEGLGVAAMMVGVATLAITGASRHLTAPIFAMPAIGAGLFLASGFSDIYGVVTPEGGTGAALPGAATVEARVATRYVYDPTVRYGTLLGPALDLRWSTLRVLPSAWLATAEDNWRLSVSAAYRPWGPRPGAVAPDGSFGELVVGGFHHRYGPERFDLNAVDLSVQGRLDLVRIAPTLAGSFFEGGLGLGLDYTHYRVGAHETEADGLLLLRFAWGLYLGHSGEAALFYDHRHDDYAGGLKLTGLLSGVPGHLGAAGTWFFGPHWGLSAEAQVGSAYLAGLSLVYRVGQP
jgi:hypothetical protein